MKAHETFNDFIKEIEGKRGYKTYSDFIDAIEGDDEKQWAEAIDQALAEAALEAFKNNMRDCMISVLKQDDVSDRHLKWLRTQMNKRIDILDKIVHLNKTEDVNEHKHSEEEGGNPEEQH